MRVFVVAISLILVSAQDASNANTIKLEHPSCVNWPTCDVPSNVPPKLLSAYQTATSSVPIRTKRAANDEPFDSFVAKMSLTARVVTAITLQNGLIDGAIPADEAIGELMNIGAVSLDDLQKVEPKTVEEFLGKVQSVAAEFHDDEYGIEKALIDANWMKRTWSNVGDLSKLPKKADFKALDSIANLDVSKVKYASIEKNIGDLEGSPSDADLGNIKTSLEALAKEVQASLSSIDLDKPVEFLDRMQPLKLFVDLVKYSMQNVINLSILSSDQNTKFGENLKKAEGLSALATTSFGTMHAVISSRVSHVVIDRKHTPGLVNGFSDLQKLSDDTSDTWLSGIIDPSIKPDALKPLLTIKEKADSLNDKWQSISTKKNSDTLKRAASIQNSIKEADGTSQIAEQSLSSFQNIQTSSAVTIVVQKFEAVGDRVDLLALSKGSPEQVQQIRQLLQLLEPQLKVLQEAPTVKELVSSLKKEDNLVESFGLTFKSNIDDFKALKEKTNNLEKVAAGAQLLKDIRQLKTNNEFLKDVKAIAAAFSDASKLLEDVRSTAANITKVASEDAKKLSKFKELKTYSKPLGDSVAAVVAVQKALAQKKTFETFVADGAVVEEEADKQQNTNLKFTIKSDWGDFERDKHEVSMLVSDLEVRKIKIKTPSGAQLVDFSPLFEEFKGLKDLDLHPDKKLEAIRALKGQGVSNQKLSGLETVLGGLSALDLQFARFSGALSEIHQTLAHVGSVWKKPSVSTSFSTSTRAPKTTKKVVQDILLVAESSSPPAALSTFSIASICLGCVLGCIFIAVVIICLLKKKPWKRTRTPKPEPVVEPIVTPIPGVEPPSVPASRAGNRRQRANSAPAAIAPQAVNPAPAAIAPQAVNPAAGANGQQRALRSPAALAPQAVNPAPAALAPQAVNPAPAALAPQAVNPAPAALAPQAVNPAPAALAPQAVNPAPAALAPQAVNPAPAALAPQAVNPAAGANGQQRANPHDDAGVVVPRAEQEHTARQNRPPRPEEFLESQNDDDTLACVASIR
ncbi:unnamed protein product [Caenorhabditis sp. 36 PRJEB53466]|nr:unnamed protein product [Caenorhabditis sp. 36 PRJEB53466]